MENHDTSYYRFKSGSGNPNIFERLGHPGRFFSSIPFSGSETVNFTGSNSSLANYGAGGIILSNNTGVEIHLSGGGMIPGNALSTNTLYELSVSKIISTTGVGYVLLKNQVVR